MLRTPRVAVHVHTDESASIYHQKTDGFTEKQESYFSGNADGRAVQHDRVEKKWEDGSGPGWRLKGFMSSQFSL